MMDYTNELCLLSKEIDRKDRETAKYMMKDHVATMKNLGDVTIIDLRKPGYLYEEWIRYLFENDEHRLIISGDFGDAIVWNGYRDSNICIDKIHQFFKDPYYFAEKIRASEDGKLWRYDEESARLELQRELMNIDEADLVNAYYLDGNKDDFINDLLYEFTWCDGFKYIGIKYADVLDRLDDNLICKMQDMGKVLSRNVYYYLEGLELAMKQLQIGIYSK